jgi:hypothetical protein
MNKQEMMKEALSSVLNQDREVEDEMSSLRWCDPVDTDDLTYRWDSVDEFDLNDPNIHDAVVDAIGRLERVMGEFDEAGDSARQAADAISSTYDQMDGLLGNLNELLDAINMPDPIKVGDYVALRPDVAPNGGGVRESRYIVEAMAKDFDWVWVRPVFQTADSSQWSPGYAGAGRGGIERLESLVLLQSVPVTEAEA